MKRRFMNSSKVAFDYLNYMTIEALDDEVQILYTRDSEYGINGIGWNKYIRAVPIIIKKGQLISFKNNLNIGELSGNFGITGKCNLRGNCLSLIFGDNAKDNKDISLYEFSLTGLFINCIGIQSVDKNFLPATKLARSCYQLMFSGCTSLVNAPDLPATTLVSYCYRNMFEGCTSLVTAPELSATTLDSNCYECMFSGCTSLVNAPKLPATTLANECCYFMFYNCTSLTVAPELPATVLAGGCYKGMFYGCSKLNYIKAMFTITPGSGYTSNWVYGVASSGTFVKNKNATWNVTGVNGIPSGWTVKTE